VQIAKGLAFLHLVARTVHGNLTPVLVQYLLCRCWLLTWSIPQYHIIVENARKVRIAHQGFPVLEVSYNTYISGRPGHLNTTKTPRKMHLADDVLAWACITLMVNWETCGI
jgi:hypothetical protein